MQRKIGKVPYYAPTGGGDKLQTFRGVKKIESGESTINYANTI
jgi:hypothetical protein